jgi:vacuolar protein sorting-associated protein 45
MEMISSTASTFPTSIYTPPQDTAPNAPALNLQLGNLNVNLGGVTPGVYRTSNEGGASVQADGLRDGMRNLIGKVKQGVDRIGLQ